MFKKHCIIKEAFPILLSLSLSTLTVPILVLKHSPSTLYERQRTLSTPADIPVVLWTCQREDLEFKSPM